MIWILLAVVLLATPTYALSIDPLPSWNQGKAKQSIIEFVSQVTDKDSESYVAPDKRIAVFDNDGTLWCEKPLYPQFIFASNRYKQLAKKDKKNKPAEPVFSYALNDDYISLAGTGSKGIQLLVGQTHFGMTAGDFENIVLEWMNHSKHPRFKRPFNECVYQPMKEVLNYLRDNEFKTFIVSGGGRDFMRPWCKKTYGIPPYQIVGSSCKLKFDSSNNTAKVVRLNKIEFLNDGKEKPVGIQKYIGIKPIAAFGNSDGDFEMLDWTQQGKGKKLCMIVHHTDSEREYAYDKDSAVGHLERSLKEAPKKGWVVIDMKEDWSEIFSSK